MLTLPPPDSDRVKDNNPILQILNLTIMSEIELHEMLMNHVLSYDDRMSNNFPTMKLEKKPKILSCYRCGQNASAAGQCRYHDDLFVLTVPSIHMGLVIGKGGATLARIKSSAGLTSLWAPPKENIHKELELVGSDTAIETAVEMIAKTLSTKTTIGSGRWRCCSQRLGGTKCRTFSMHLTKTIFQDPDLLVETKTSTRDPIAPPGNATVCLCHLLFGCCAHALPGVVPM